MIPSYPALTNFKRFWDVDVQFTDEYRSIATRTFPGTLSLRRSESNLVQYEIYANWTPILAEPKEKVIYRGTLAQCVRYTNRMVHLQDGVVRK